MAQDFVGRESEIKIFKELLESKKPELLAIYGRRRVGKTFLIRKFFKTKIVFDFSGSFEADMKVQIENFFHEYLRWTKSKRETSPPQSWSEAFRYLTDFLYSLKHRKRKIVVFIDELPWLDTPRSNFLTSLEYFWNQHGSNMNNLLFIVCGSSASWIKNKLIRAKGGLYNRVTRSIKLDPFSLHEVEEFLRYKKIKLSRYQIIQCYMVMGGIPFYLEALKRGKSFRQQIDEICFTSSGLLSNEYSSLYVSLFKNAENHIAIVEALASKPQGLLRNDLVKLSGLPDGGTFNRTLEELHDSDFIHGFQAYGKVKKGIKYKLTDYFSLFYLKFMKGNVSKKKNSWNQIESSVGFRSWCGYTFENICLTHIDQIKQALGIEGIQSKASTWQHLKDKKFPGAQIDIVIDRADKVINLCEVKFTTKPFYIDKQYVQVLRNKRSIFEYTTKSKSSLFTTLITTFPCIKNEYYFEEIENEITMDALFLP